MKTFFCDVCRKNDWESIYEKQIVHPLWWIDKQNIDIKLQYIICRQCGYITLFPRMKYREYEAYYRLAPVPSRNAFLKRKPMLEVRREFILHHVQQNNVVSDVVIEIGPAYGDFLAMLPEFKKRIGVEPSADYFDSSKITGIPFEYHNCMLEEIPARAPALLSSANLVVASNVLEHAFNPRDFINHLAKLVKGGGYIYLEVPSVEAMAECKNPAYQTIHFGHISQFSIPVLNRLCISENLDPVRVEFTVKDNYPAIRALYRKGAVNDIARFFKQHCKYLDDQVLTGKEILLEQSNSGNRNILIWGCGNDLLDILSSLDDFERAQLSNRVKLVDTNSLKHHKRLFGIEIQGPSNLLSHQVDTVLIASRSELIKDDIMGDARNIFPGAQIFFLYP
jgi:SAM-dependent methyltransferase